MNTKKRIWEVDTLRGLAIILMIVNHFIYNMGYTFFSGFYDTPIFKFALWSNQFHGSSTCRLATYLSCSCVFIFLSGVSSTFSRKPIKRGLMIFGFSLILTLITLALSKIIKIELTIWFGILHCLGLCIILSPIFLKLPKFILPFLAITFMVLGLYFNQFTTENIFLVILNFNNFNFMSSDYFPLTPFLGVFVYGIYFGRTWYTNKQSLFPFDRPKILKPLSFIGKYPLKIYIGHQIVLYVLFYLATYLIQIL